jgi:hypothetical protein
MGEFKIGADLTSDQVLERIRLVRMDGSIDQLILDLGTSKKMTILDNKMVEDALIEMLVQSWMDGRKWKLIRLDFASQGFVEQGSKQEGYWDALEQKARQQISRLGRTIQRRLDLDGDTQIRVDGDIHTDVDPDCNCKYTGIAIISFPQVSE